jgi:hypothetical protein
VQQERRIHLHLLSELLRPGGRALLISDIVSSDTAPTLLDAPAKPLPELMHQLVAGGNFFTGLNPYLIAEQLAKDPAFGVEPEQVTLHDPWLWPLSPARGYLVFAISFVRRQR